MKNWQQLNGLTVAAHSKSVICMSALSYITYKYGDDYKNSAKGFVEVDQIIGDGYEKFYIRNTQVLPLTLQDPVASSCHLRLMV
ncbi:hypothetical protein ACRTDJ_05335 [Shewanella algae]